MHTPSILQPGLVRLSELRPVFAASRPVALAGGWDEAVRRSAQTMSERLDADVVMNGINTGFGLLAHTRIRPCTYHKDQLEVPQGARSILRAGHPAAKQTAKKMIASQQLLRLVTTALVASYATSETHRN